MASPILRMRVPHFLALLSITALSGCTSLTDYVHNGFKVGPNYAKPPAQVAPLV